MSNTAMTPDQFFDELDKLFGTDDGYENHLKRIKGLKKENEKLVGVIDSVKAHLDDDEHVVISTPLKYAPIVNAIERLKKKNELLNQNRELLKEQNELLIQKHQKSIDIFKEEIEKGTRASKDAVKFMNENELLKKELELYKQAESLIQPFENPQALSVKIKELKQKNDELVDNWNDLHERADEVFEALKNWRDNAQIVVPLEEHEQKIEELQTQLQSTENYWKSKYENEESTNKMLNDAIINHTEILDELRTYLSNFEGDVLEVFDKIVNSTD